MKITFLEVPPLNNKKVPERFAGCSYELYHLPDLANLYMVSCLVKEGFEVGYIDSIIEGHNSKEFYRILKEDDSDIYIIHSVILSKESDLTALKEIRKFRKDVRFIFHGPEPTRVPEEYLIDPEVIVARGEPEDNLITHLRNGAINGLSFYSENGGILHEPPTGRLIEIDNLPVPLRCWGPFRSYQRHYFNPKFRTRPHTTMMASRGCAFRCLFCVPNSISFARELEYMNYFKKKPNPSIASGARVIAEFKEIATDGFKSVMVMDDQFLWGKDRTLQVCDGIKDLRLEWGCLSRADFLADEEVVKALGGSGCVSIDIGIESLSQKVLDYIHKDMNVDTAYKAIALLKKYRIRPKLNIIFGACPDETPSDIEKTIKMLKKMKVDNVMFSIATPFKGTEFYDLCKKKGYLVSESDDIDPLKNSIVSYPLLKNEELERLERFAYRSFYLRPGAILRRLRSYRGIQDFINDFKILVKLTR